jgi:hypothetical protein
LKPITYWIQNEAINQLVEKYGAHLEKLTPYSRRFLIACLAVGENECECEFHRPLLERLTRHEKDLLIEAIAATLVYHGNPWLENARATVAIAQKEGTPSS